MDSRTYNNDKYRFGFNGKEKEDGIGDGYDFGARISDNRLGRWLSIDPVINPSWSGYTLLKNSPICMIDPTGETDFYNMDGKWIGTDGDKKNMSVVIIQNSKLERKINKLAKKGQDYKAELPNGSYYTLPSDDINKATLKVFDMMSTEVDGIENSDGAHEAGTAFNKEGKNLGFSNSKKIFTQEMANDQILEDKVAELDIDLNVTAEEVAGGTTIHAHVTQIYEVAVNGGYEAVEFSVFKPSPTDEKTNQSAALNIIVGNSPSTLEDRTTEVSPGVFKTEQIRFPGTSTAAYYDENTVQLFSVELNSLKKIVDGSGKTDSKTHKNYEKRKPNSGN